MPNFNIRLKKITASFSGPAGSCGDFAISLPLLECSLDGCETGGYFAIEIPLIQASLTGGINHGSFEVELPAITASFSGSVNHGSFAITVPRMRASFEGRSAGGGTFAITLPKIAVSSWSGYGPQEGSFAIVLPLIEVNFEGGTLTYLCLVLNNEVALTQWNYTFDSFAELDGTVYAFNSSGMFSLGGDTDNGSNIASVIQTGLDDAGISNQKQAEGWFVAMRSDGKCQLQIIADDVTDSRVHDLRNTGDALRERRGMTEQGPRGRYLGAKIINVSGADFRIVSLGVLAKSLDRKYSNHNA